MFLELNMPKYDSSLGSKSFAGSPLREFDVPEGGIQYGSNPNSRLGGYAPQVDAAVEFQERMEQESSQESVEFERSMKEARDAKRTGKTRLNEGARRRIEMLVGMSRTTHEADIGGNQYAFQTLGSKEMRTAIMAASAFDGSVQSPFEIRRQLLGYSLTKIAGLDVAQFVGSNDIEAKLELIDNLDDALLNRLYDEYLLMVKESREKYAIKTEEDAKEVAEDLKK